MAHDRPALTQFGGRIKGTRAAAAQAPPALPDAAPDLDGPIRNVSAHLPAALRVRAFEAARSRGVTITDLLFAALDDALGPAAPAALDLRPAPLRHSSGMPAARRRARGGEGTVQVQLRLTAAQRQWLDEQAAARGAANRSEFVTAVLRQHLVPR